MKLNVNRITERIIKHSLFWLVFFLTLFIVSGGDAFNRKFLIFDLPITLVYVYLITYYIIPFFLLRKRYLFLIVSFAAISLLFSYLRLVNYNYFYYSMFEPGLSEMDQNISFSQLILNAKDFSFGLFIFLAAKYTNSWLNYESGKLHVENEQLESEILLMKTQVDHHFLFNTLNNIYSLSVTEPAKTQFSIKKFWGILDYIARFAEVKEIRIERELKLIADYVELERLRYGERLDFSLSLDNSLKEFRIPPLILFPFIENCFKYGSALDPGKPWIKIDINDRSDRIRFNARNSWKRTELSPNERNEINKTIERIKKRLDFQLGGRYLLKINEASSEYSVRLDLLY